MFLLYIVYKKKSHSYIIYTCIYCKYYSFGRLLNPVLKRLDKSKQKELEAQIQKQFDPVDVSSL